MEKEKVPFRKSGHNYYVTQNKYIIFSVMGDGAVIVHNLLELLPDYTINFNLNSRVHVIDRTQPWKNCVPAETYINKESLPHYNEVTL